MDAGPPSATQWRRRSTFTESFVDLELDPPRIVEGATSPPFYFGGFSPAAKDVAAAEADVFLTWPDTVSSVGDTVNEMTTLAAERYDRELIYGLRAHVIVRETEAEARSAAEHLVSKLDADTGDAIRNKSLDAASFGVARQAALREGAADDGFVEDNLWTGVGRARSGAGAAIVGNPDQVAAKLQAYQGVGIGALHPVRVHPCRRMRLVCRARAAETRARADQAPISRTDHRTVLSTAGDQTESRSGPLPQLGEASFRTR